MVLLYWLQAILEGTSVDVSPAIGEMLFPETANLRAYCIVMLQRELTRS